jgi:hypothetical protein
LGHDVLTALQDGKANQAITDADLLARAIELELTLLTLNRQDFKRLHFEFPNHAGIIICTEDPDRLGQAERIDRAIAETVIVSGKLIRVYRPVK